MTPEQEARLPKYAREALSAKLEKNCTTCKHQETEDYNHPCGWCNNFYSGWEPSLKAVKAVNATQVDKIQSLCFKLTWRDNEIALLRENRYHWETRSLAQADEIERLRGLASEALDNLAVMDEACWNELTGDTTLTEHHTACISEARDFLKQVLLGTSERLAEERK